MMRGFQWSSKSESLCARLILFMRQVSEARASARACFDGLPSLTAPPQPGCPSGTPGRASDTTLSPWFGLKTANFIINFAGQHQREHLPVAHERPERMRESCRPVLFDEEMSRPRQAVTRHKRQRKQPPPARRDEENQQHDRNESTDGVQRARGRLPVLTQIVWPEVSELIEPALSLNELSAYLLADGSFASIRKV